MQLNLGLITFYFCCGITFAHFVRFTFWHSYFSSCIILIFSLCIKKESLAKILLPCLIFSFGALLLKNANFYPKNHISNFIFYKNHTIYTVKGFIITQPEIEGNSTSFKFRLQELEFKGVNRKCSGDILVHAKEAKGLSYGEALILKGGIHKSFKLYGDSVPAVMYTSGPNSAIKLNKNYGGQLHKIAFFLKNKIEEIIYQRLSRFAAGIIDAMILGDKSGVPEVIYASMARTGTVHILVVSGFNVGIVAGLALLILKILRLPRFLRYIAAIFLLFLYCLATGVQTPVLRATIMAVFFLTGFLIKREPDIRFAFSLAVLFILLINPKELFSISFQLSFASVAGIVFMQPKLKAFFKVALIKARALRFIAEAALVSFSAWLATFGFIAYHFKFFSPVTVFANIIIVPLATLMTLSGFSLAIVSLIFPLLAGPIACATEVFVFLLLKANNLLAHLPFAYLTISV